jgi:hypothetical protein
MFMQDRLRLVSSIIYHVIIKLMSDIILVLVLIIIYNIRKPIILLLYNI